MEVLLGIHSSYYSDRNTYRRIEVPGEVVVERRCLRKRGACTLVELSVDRLLVGREFFDPFDIPLQRSLLWAILGFECIRIALYLDLLIS
jgi:hypothetical protein